MKTSASRAQTFARTRAVAGIVVVLLACGSAVAADVVADKTAAPTTGRATAPVDVTGYWVSVIHTDWRWRMLTPVKGDFNMLPLTAAGKAAGESWDPAKDVAAGEQCRAYGAAGLMRMPGRLHITWQDANTLKVEADAGTQTRLLRFAAAQTPSADAQRTWQGSSVANWERVILGAPEGKETSRVGTLHVVTTNMRPGYLRRNGVPYSADALLTEDWELLRQPDGTDWLLVSTALTDPVYLQMPWLTSPVFKRERDGSKWDPTPCASL